MVHVKRECLQRVGKQVGQGHIQEDDAASIHRDLIDALYGTPGPIIIGATTVAVVMVGAGIISDHDKHFYAFAAVMAAIGAIRLYSHYLYRLSKTSNIQTISIHSFEYIAMFGAWSTAATIGSFGAYAIAYYESQPASVLAIAQTIGYLAGLSGRNTSRPVITRVQTLAVSLPFVFALIATGKSTYILIGLTVLLTVMLTFSSATVIYNVFVSRQKTLLELVKMVNLDPLTNLYNRRGFIIELQRASDLNDKYTLISLDVDNFKNINDTYGHDVGDALICSLSADIAELIGRSGVAARMGGDEFMIVTAGHAQSASQLATRLLHLAQVQRLVANRTLTVTVSIGIVEAEGGLPFEEAMKRVDIALYKAKSEGRNRCISYSPALSKAYDDQVALEAEMREGIRQGQFWLAYQPIYNPRSGTVTHVEALMRWAHPTRGSVSPAVFIPVAERTGLIKVLGAWALEEAARTAASFERSVKISVNVSPFQFDQDHDIVAIISAALAKSGLPANRFIIEVTESTIVGEDTFIVDTLKKIRSMGVRIALDDFGTGFSSLSYLAWLPINILKIDKSFCREIETSQRARALMSAITQLAHDLDLMIIVEGIETDEQLAVVQQYSVHGIQGYVYAKPMSDIALRDVIDVRINKKQKAQKQAAVDQTASAAKKSSGIA